jgi:lipopolysaccharide export system protein LptC
VAVLLWAGVSLGPLAGCTPTLPSEPRNVVPELKLDTVRYRLYRGDALRASGVAATLSYRRDTRDVAATGIAATLLEPGRAPVELTAPDGDGSLEARTFTVRGGVRASRGTDVATTPAATYAADAAGRGAVSGAGPIEVLGTGYRLDGTGFTLDPATGELVVRGGARLVAAGAEAR